MVELPDRTSSARRINCMLLHVKLPLETPKKLIRSNGRIYSYGPFEPVLWSCWWNCPIGHRLSEYRFRATPCKTASGNSWKNIRAILRSDLKLWTFWAGTLVVSFERPDLTLSAWRTDFTLHHVKSLWKHPKKNLERSNGLIYSYGPFKAVH